MPFDLVIRNGNVVTPDGVIAATVAVTDGEIVEIGDIAGSAKEEIDATGLHVFPGLIDPHVHFNEPGRTDWEGIATGSAALAAGGGTCFFDMPLNSSPPTLDGPSFDLKRDAAEASSVTDFALWGGLTPNNLDKMEELADRGVIGFKAFMSNSGIDDFLAADDFTLYRGMQIAASRGLVVAVHAENDSITTGLAEQAIRAGRTSAIDYLKSRPVVAEVEAIHRAIAIAADTKCKLHIVHVSSAEGSWAAHAAGNKFDVTYETCPHYFLLTEDDVPALGAVAKCAPPVRTRQDADHFRFVFSTGEISFVASDHSPSPPSMKIGNDFFKIWGGIAGVQSTLAAMISIDPPLPPHIIAGYTAANIAKRFGLTGKGKLARGMDADFALVNLREHFELRREDLLDRHKQSPYVGKMFRGVVRRTISRGQTICENGKPIHSRLGRLIKGAAHA